MLQIKNLTNNELCLPLDKPLDGVSSLIIAPHDSILVDSKLYDDKLLSGFFNRGVIEVQLNDTDTQLPNQDQIEHEETSKPKNIEQPKPKEEIPLKSGNENKEPKEKGKSTHEKQNSSKHTQGE